MRKNNRKGFTIVEHIEFVERGYENLEGKLCGLGAYIEKMDSEDDRAVQKFKLKVS